LARRPNAINLAQAISVGLDDVEYRLAERLDHLPGIDRADAADHAGGEIRLDAVDRRWRRAAHEARLELLTVGLVVDPITCRGDPLAGGDHGRVPDDGDEVAMSARLDAQNAEAVVRIVVGDALNGAGECLGRIGRRSITIGHNDHAFCRKEQPRRKDRVVQPSVLAFSRHG
jgi:hypothetical protein